MPTSLTYITCIVNSIKFLVEVRDVHHKTQNSGVFVPGINDKPFYYVLQDVVVIQYIHECSVILMNVSNKKKLKTYQNITSIFCGAKWYKDELFILSRQVQWVFYKENLINGSFLKVAHQHTTRHIWDRHIWDLPEDTKNKPHQEASCVNFELFF